MKTSTRISRRNQTVGAYEAKTRFSELLERVEAGGEIIVTKHGTPVARLMPFKKELSAEQRAEAIRRIQELSAGLSLGGLQIKDLIEQGRR
jgi:prevent-host-death family protein